MRVISTAGHVDHGKSTLVEALTGTHPDRLKEEREREMTIDLGFAFFTLPNGEEIGIVDVPGHRDFIENMLAGVGGIDAALFVVAADEGVMPQTREHLAILDLLHVRVGVVALTKVDVVDDPDWLALVEDDLRTVLSGTVLESATLVRVSGKARLGISELVQALMDCLEKSPPRPDLGRPRLPVDRVFTVAGFGTVVTGTLTDGQMAKGQAVEILPGRIGGRIRGLHSRNQKADIVAPGSRTAINISGVNIEKVRRGNWIVYPGDYLPTRRLDLQFRQLGDVTQPVNHNIEIKFFVGAAEELGRLRLLGTDVLLPGQEGWIQVELREPVVATRGDRYIIRRPSPGETLGGGMVVDSHPKGRHKRFAGHVIARLESLARGLPEDVYHQAILTLGTATTREVTAKSTLIPEVAAQALNNLLETGEIIPLEKGDPFPDCDTLLISRTHWNAVVPRLIQEVATCHRLNPLRRGIPREELKSRLQLSTRVFNAVLQKLVDDAKLAGSALLVWQPDHRIVFHPDQEKVIQRLLARFAATPFLPPSVKESQAEVAHDVYAALVDLEEIIQVSMDVVFRKEDYDRLVAETTQIIRKNGPITIAKFRDHFQTTRKYALAFLEYLDSTGVTVREGDERRLKAR